MENLNALQIKVAYAALAHEIAAIKERVVEGTEAAARAFSFKELLRSNPLGIEMTDEERRMGEGYDRYDKYRDDRCRELVEAEYLMMLLEAQKYGEEPESRDDFIADHIYGDLFE